MNSETNKEKETCETCRFYYYKSTPYTNAYINEKKDEIIENSNLVHSECQRYPTPISKEPDSWCGEHKRKEETI